MDWQAYENQEPWGDLRADMRGLAQVLNLKGIGDDIELMFPYIKDPAEMYEKHKELEARRDDPATQAKLKEARAKHREAMKKNGA